MKVFVAGATGAVGIPTVRALVAAGYEVVGMTRTPSKAAMLEGLGARPAVADALDSAAVRSAVAAAAPDAVVSLLTDLPKRGPTRESHLATTNTLRRDGTANLLAAAIAAGARRYVSESIVLGYAARGSRVTEEDAFADGDGDYPYAEPLRALASLESQVLGAARDGRIAGIVLRFGLFYGPTAGTTEFMTKMLRRRMLRLPHGEGAMPWIHVDDAAEAVRAALETARSGEVYNIVDDEPASARALAEELARALGARRPGSMSRLAARVLMPYVSEGLTQTLIVSNEKAARELGWRPRYPTYREGLRARAG